MTKGTQGFCFCLIAAVFAVGVANAQVVMPPVNLGGTSFMDGMAGPGILIEPGVVEHYHGGQFMDAKGTVIPGGNSIDTWSNLLHVGYISKKQLFGAFLGAEFLLPFASVDIRTDFGPRGQQSGFGDLLVSPLIMEWAGRKVADKPFFSRFSILAELPTGAYDASKPVNIGSNAGALFAYYAFTMLPSKQLETSWRVNYRWNAKNSTPFLPLGFRSTQAGQAIHVNYALSYELSPRVRAGFNGYALEQLTEHRIDGKPMVNSKERVVAFGPGGVVSSGLWSMLANLDFETMVRNRPKGYRLNVTFRRIVPR